MAWFAGEPREKEVVLSDFYLMKKLLPYLKDQWHRILIAVVATVFYVAGILIAPLITREALNNALPNKDTKQLIFLSLLYVANAAMYYIVTIIMSYFIQSAGRHLIFNIREDLMAKVERLSMSYHSKTPTGKKMSILQNDVQRLLQLVVSGVVDNVAGILRIFGIYVVMLQINWELALVALLFLPAVVLLLIYFRNKAREAYQITRKTVSRLNIAFQEHISGIRVTKSFNREEYNFMEFSDLSEENLEAQVTAIRYFAMVFPVFDIIIALTTISIFMVGGPMYLSGNLKIGDLSAFLSYLTRLFDPILFFIMFYNTFQSAMAATERIVKLLEYPMDVEEADPDELVPMPDKIEGAFDIKHLTFSYEEELKDIVEIVSVDEGAIQRSEESKEKDETANELTYVYRDFNLAIKPREVLAIAGPTGAGKTTLINIIGRFFDFDKGTITLDGIDIRKLPLRDYRKSLGIILQEPFLFDGTLRENITYGFPEASDEKIKKICDLIGIWEWIQGLDDGLEHEVGERGGKLSLGYRQLVTLARTLLSNPKLLLLDEATSSIDPYAEMLVQRALEELIENRTTIVIAHRLSTIRNADRIIYIEDGAITEQGTFDELLELDGEFAKQYRMQFST